MDNLWFDVGTKCLTHAKELLDRETAPTAATVETAQKLVHMAIEIDALNLQWEQQSRYGAAAFGGRPSWPQATEN